MLVPRTMGHWAQLKLEEIKENSTNLAYWIGHLENKCWVKLASHPLSVSCSWFTWRVSSTIDKVVRFSRIHWKFATWLSHGPCCSELGENPSLQVLDDETFHCLHFIEFWGRKLRWWRVSLRGWSIGVVTFALLKITCRPLLLDVYDIPSIPPSLLKNYDCVCWKILLFTVL